MIGLPSDSGSHSITVAAPNQIMVHILEDHVCKPWGFPTKNQKLYEVRLNNLHLRAQLYKKL